MARIRTIKPEIWTDPEFIELSELARLLFIASLNFASDHGVIHNKPRQLKMLCLPADECDINALIEECVSQRFYIPCMAPNGDPVLVIRTFAKNQRINRPTAGRWGNPLEWANTPIELLSTGGLTHGRDNLDNSDNTDKRPESVSPDVFGALPAWPQTNGEAIRLTRAQRNHALKTNGAPARLIAPTTHPL